MESQLIINFLEEVAPPSLQESYDNSGWIVKLSKTCNKALISLDCTPEVVE
ncbi:MAG: Nif3-like dinuclear metal center hexameric protein, partial [Bacteroidetes bacterium]|nr:Nif3-like dinuclear metal center hexameric protein [Bacteroidota bacterium]